MKKLLSMLAFTLAVFMVLNFSCAMASADEATDAGLEQLTDASENCVLGGVAYLGDSGVYNLTNNARSCIGYAAFDRYINPQAGFGITLDYYIDGEADGIGVALTSAHGSSGSRIDGDCLGMCYDADLIAVALDIWDDRGVYGNHVEIVNGQSNGYLTGVLAAAECDSLNDAAWHTLTIRGDQTGLQVYIDGTPYVQADGLSLPDTVYLTVSAATGSGAATQLVRNVRIMNEITVIASGECGAEGSNLSWVLDDMGILSITGEGRMRNFEDAPWYENREAIRLALIREGVTSIGDYAFADCANLANVSIPDSLTSLGAYIFQGCESLTGVSIPAGVTEIADDTFADCPNLTRIKVVSGSYASDWCLRTGLLTLSQIYESAHPYATNANEKWSYSHGSEAAALKLSFSEDTEFGRYNDFLTIIDSTGRAMRYGGTKLAGATIVLPGDTFQLYLTTDDFDNSYGFQLTAIEAMSDAEYEQWLWEQSQAEVIVIASGTCGADEDEANVVWTLDSTGTLTISGTGRMRDYIDPPWLDCQEDVMNAVIVEGVTNIGESAFWNCHSLSSVSIPGSVTEIGGWAFEGCACLTRITVPEGVTSIGYGAFRNCPYLTSVILPASVTRIADDAFDDYNSELTITAPEDSYAHEWAEEHGLFGEVKQLTQDGVVYMLLSNRAVIKGYTDDVTDAVIPAQVNGLPVRKIADNAFSDCVDLTSITIPEGVTYIGEYAFSYCSRLTDVTLPSSVTTIANGAFESCRSLTSITIPKGVTEIADNCFTYCEGLTEIVIPEGVTYIGSGAFHGCGGLTSIVIPEGVTYIGEFAFDSCENLRSVTLPESVTRIDEDAFSNCSSDLVIYAPEGSYAADWVEENNLPLNAKIVSEGGLTYAVSDREAIVIGYAGTDAELVIPAQFDGAPVTRISKDAFKNCTSLTSIGLPKGLTYIGESAFEGCTALNGADLPEGVTSIGQYAFKDCTALTSVTLPESLTQISFSAFSGCSSLNGIVLPEGLTGLGQQAFERCTSLTSIVIPRGVTKLGYNTFNRCTSLSSVTLHENLTVLEQQAFYGCTSLTDIDLPEGLTELGYGVFSDCTRLASINLPKSLRYLSGSVFNGCTSLSEIVIPEGVTTIFGSTFYRCTGLTSVNLPEGVTDIYWGAFSGCSSLTSIVLPESLRYIGGNAFEGCTSLAEITIPAGVTGIDGSTFKNCSGLTSITLPDSMTYIGQQAFERCASLTSVKLPANLTSIGSYAFTECTGLTGITLPAGVRSIGYGAFDDCSGLQSITIPQGVTSLEGQSFAGCTSLTSVSLPSSLTSIKVSAFHGCSSLTSIDIPKNVTSLADYVFLYCANLERITFHGKGEISIGNDAIPSSVTICCIKDSGMDRWATDNGYAVEYMEEHIHTIVFVDGIPATHVTPGRTGFAYCTECGEILIESEIIPVVEVQKLLLPAQLETIEDEAFAGDSIACVVLPDGCTGIGAGAFRNCTELRFVEIPASVTGIDSTAFEGCSDDLIIVTTAGSEAERFAEANGITYVLIN